MLSACFRSHALEGESDAAVPELDAPTPAVCEPGTLVARWLGPARPGGPQSTYGPVAHRGAFYVLRIGTRDEFRVERLNLDGTLSIETTFVGEIGALPGFQSVGDALMVSRHPSDGRGNRRLVVTVLGDESPTTWSTPIPSLASIVPTSPNEWWVKASRGFRRIGRDGRWQGDWLTIPVRSSGLLPTPTGDGGLVFAVEGETIHLGAVGDPFDTYVAYEPGEGRASDVLSNGSRALGDDVMARLLDRPSGLVVSVFRRAEIARALVSPSWEPEVSPRILALGTNRFAVAFVEGEDIRIKAYDATSIRDAGPETALRNNGFEREVPWFAGVSGPIGGTVTFRLHDDLNERFGLVSLCE